MKKVLSILLCLTFLFTLAACNTTPPIDESLFADTYGTVDVSSDPIAFNYLTGRYDMPEDRVGMRPFCISIDNAEGSWPQSGLSIADILIEMETEYGITRLMAIYDDSRDIELVGPVRSLRDQFLEMIYPLDPIIVHIGYSVVAGRKLAENNIRTLDGDIVNQFIYIDQERVSSGYPSWQTKFTSGLNIADGIDLSSLDTQAFGEIGAYFNFIEPDDTYQAQSGTASKVTFMYSANDLYDGDFRYDAATGKYQKFQRNEPHMDAAYNTQLSFDNVIVLQANITSVDETELVNIDYQGGGTAYYFNGGYYEEVTWAKGDYSATIEFFRADGSALPFNTGTTMIALMRSENADTLQITP